MKALLLTLFGLFSIATAYSQCDAPIVENWSAPAIADVTVNFTPPEGAQSYTLNITGQYGQSDFGTAIPLVLTGSVVPGINAVNFDVSSILSNLNPVDTYYFTAELSVTCSNGDESGINKFYISAFSLLNDPGIDFGDLFFKPFTYLADGTGFIQDSYIAVPAAEFPEEIEDISVFIDLGHTYNGDLSVELISPQGASVTLLSWPNALGANMGFSVIFKDGQPNIDSTGAVFQGFFSPSESLSVLEGLNPEGVWVVRVTDNLGIDDGMLFGVALIINTSPCESSLQGTTYYDLNSNSTQDLEEPGYGNALINNSLDGQNIFASSSGQYSDCSLSGNGLLSLTNPPLYYAAADVPFTISSGEILDNLDLELIPEAGNEDLQIDMFTSTPDRPGFDSEYMVYYQNIGTECIDNVEINIDLDALLLITAVSNPAISFSGNTASLALEEICPMESGMFSLTAFLNDTVSLETLLESTAQILPVDGDENPTDNVSVYESIVIGSYDPNDKSVSNQTISPNFIEDQAPLKYLIRFQNTGTYYAERVLVVDTLDANLDLNSFSLLSTSHDVDVTRNGNVFYFEFDEIFLPDSTTNEPDSHGFIRYDVNPIGGLVDGEAIENTAYIFFDFNAPIITNTVSTVMDFASAIDEITYEAKVYPNPATSEINLEWAPTIQIHTIQLFDIAGREIATFSANGKEKLIIPVGRLAAGLYTFQFKGDASVKPVVWIKY